MEESAEHAPSGTLPSAPEVATGSHDANLDPLADDDTLDDVTTPSTASETSSVPQQQPNCDATEVPDAAALLFAGATTAPDLRRSSSSSGVAASRGVGFSLSTGLGRRSRSRSGGDDGDHGSSELVQQLQRLCRRQRQRSEERAFVRDVERVLTLLRAQTPASSGAGVTSATFPGPGLSLETLGSVQEEDEAAGEERRSSVTSNSSTFSSFSSMSSSDRLRETLTLAEIDALLDCIAYLFDHRNPSRAEAAHPGYHLDWLSTLSAAMRIFFTCTSPDGDALPVPRTVRLEALEVLRVNLWTSRNVCEDRVIEEVVIPTLGRIYEDPDAEVRRRGLWLIIEVARQLESMKFDSLLDILASAMTLSSNEDAQLVAVSGIVSLFSSAFDHLPPARTVRMYDLLATTVETHRSRDVRHTALSCMLNVCEARASDGKLQWKEQQQIRTSRFLFVSRQAARINAAGVQLTASCVPVARALRALLTLVSAEPDAELFRMAVKGIKTMLENRAILEDVDVSEVSAKVVASIDYRAFGRAAIPDEVDKLLHDQKDDLNSSEEDSTILIPRHHKSQDDDVEENNGDIEALHGLVENEDEESENEMGEFLLNDSIDEPLSIPVQAPRVLHFSSNNDSTSAGMHGLSALSNEDQYDPTYLMMQLFDITLENRPNLLSDGPSLRLALSVLDRTPEYETHKIGLLYVRDEKQSSESAILGNTGGSPRYLPFLRGLGTFTKLEGLPGYSGGLDTTGNSDGQFGLIYKDACTQIMFHVATMMVPDSNRSVDSTVDNFSSMKKKRHIGNDFVHVVFKECDEDYDLQTLSGQFNDVHIVIQPLNDREYRTEVHVKAGIPPFGPLYGKQIVSSSIISETVRLTCLNANLACQVFHQDLVGFALNCEERLKQIKQLGLRLATADEWKLD
ncbi:hypothetical protein JG688_00002116 [Phytophthora aleatoria]|uniref:Rap-GAP domain-containing protein n=1 Tax=Phytophthora aleatoria TaxID=2496075 RepID=A0A8J5IW40_9STRA|nr:hypothetical protein JG688_00002116 [Phytophthora aleatoria]